VLQHHWDEVFEVELDGVEVHHHVIFEHPEEVAVVRIVRAALLAAEHHIEHFMRQFQVFRRTISDKLRSKARALPGLVEDAVFGHFG